MKLLYWLLPLAAVGGFAWWIQSARNTPPEVTFTKAKRERLVSNLTTNGKVEPLDWREVRSEREGLLSRVTATKGQSVTAGQVLAELDSADARAELAAAESRIAQARIELDVLRAGGRVRETTELASSIDRLRVDQGIAQREVDALSRLVERKAATKRELDAAKERVEQMQAEIASLEKRRQALVGQPDKDIAEARLRDAEAVAATARRRIAMSLIHSPIAGVIYQLDVRAGGYVRPGDLLAHVGVLNRVRVNVYVDEPELGNVRAGLPVTLTWDAEPGKRWSGTVDRMPSQIIALGSRQVGEVQCIIDNDDLRLIPNTNVNAEIRVAVVENAIAVPKEVIRREKEVSGVYLLEGTVVRWRPLKLGTASVTRRQVLEGLKEGDPVALPTDTPLKDGTVVRPILTP